MKPIIYLIFPLFLILFSNSIFALDESNNPALVTIDSTKGAKINIYCYENMSADRKEKPLLLVHGFNSKGSVWNSANENKDYVNNLRKNGYDVIVVDMRGNPVDTDGDHRADSVVVGNSWGYGVRDLGDDVGVALAEGMGYLNKNLPGRNYTIADVITHSTGALAVTAYSRSLGLFPYRDNIGTIIELAPPNNGSTSMVANMKNILGIIPSVFAQSMTAYQYALEVAENKIWIPGSRMESENLRKELSPDSMFLKSIQDLGPDKRIKTFIAIGNEDWVVGDWSPVIGKRDDIGYEYFLGIDHFNFCNSETVLTAILNKLKKGDASNFFNRFKPYKNKQLAFLSGPGIDHPDDTFDTIDFAKGVDISPAKLFDLYLRIAGRKNKAYLLKYWEILSIFKDVQSEISKDGDIDNIIDEWNEILGQKNQFLRNYHKYASREYLESPDIALLANGYYNEMRKLIIEKVEEPVRIIDHAFEPYILDEQKILVIPTGGLSGLSHSAIFKNKLSEYVKNGGIVVCFSQQYGYDFNALPGGKLNAYGWQEDASCHAKAAYIENFHQIFSSQLELYPDIKMDGYFTDYPEGATVLLRRSKNQMPAMLMYNFEKGMVIVSSIYSDWGYLNGQASSSEINLVRDILRWAKSGKILPEYKIGENFEYPVQINKDFNKIEFILKSNEGEILEHNVSSEAVYKLGQNLKEAGIYSVDYILYGADSKIIQPQAEGFYFSFANPPPGIPENPEFTFDITSDSENYVSGSEAIFTFHIRNNTPKNETIRCKAELPHHEVEFNDVISVPANGKISFDKKVTVSLTDLLSASLYSSQNIFVGKAERGINVFEPGIKVIMNSDKKQYSPEETVFLSMSFENKTEATVNALVILDIADSKNNQIYYNSLETTLEGFKTGSWLQNFAIPEYASKGICKVKLNAFSGSKLVGFASIDLEIPEPLIYGEETAKPEESYSISGENLDLIINMENNYLKDQLISGSVKIGNKGENLNNSSINIRVYPEIKTWDLCGVIRDENGTVIKGAEINGVYSNKEGRYILKNIDQGDFVIDIKASGFDAVLKDIKILPGTNNLDINLITSKYGNLSGIIENSIGSIISLEPVKVSGSDTSIRFAVTSGENSFKFKYLPVGEYFLTVFPGGISGNVQINEGENIFNDMINPAIYQDCQETEPNSAFSSATEVNLGSRIHGKIYSAGDEDFFKFNIAEKGILDIKMYEVPQGLRPSIKIYNVSGQVISQKGGSANEKIVLETEFDKPGIYYLLVRDWYGNISSLNNYSIDFNFIKTLDEYEPNETKEAAKLIDFGKSYFATVAVKADSDFYKLSIPDAGKVTIYVKDMPVNIRPYVKLYKDSGQCIDIKGGVAGEDVVMELEVANPSNYYIQVYDKYNSESSFLRYVFSASYVPLDKYISVDRSFFKKCEEVTVIENEKDINFEIPAISEKGKYYIEAMLQSSDSSEIAKLVKAFYVSERLEVNVEAKLEGSILKLRIKNLSSLNSIKLFAEARCGDYENKTYFILNKEKELEFNVPNLAGNEKIYYGIYFESGKSLYLNSYLISGEEKPETPSIKIIKVWSDKDVYEDGESVFLDWKIESDGAYAVKLSADLIKPDSDSISVINEDVDLIKGMNEVIKEVSGELKQSGIYRITYEFSNIGQGSVFFDVNIGEKPKENHEPVLFNIGDKEVLIGDTLEFFIEATDIDEDMLTYSAEGLPKGAGFDPWLKRFLWEPLERQIGEHFVTFTASDGKVKASERVKIIVSGSLDFPPEIEISAEPASGIAPLEVHFGAQLADKYRDIVKYEWDFDGKGIYDFNSNESGEAVFIYTGEGSFPAALRLTDKSGTTNIYTVTINVDKNPDAPGVYLNAFPIKGIAPCKVFFRGDAFCPQGVAKYEWDFDGDGVFDASSLESGEVVKLYSFPGKYDAEFKVTSIDGLSGSERVLIEIDNPGLFSVKSSVVPAAGNVPVEVVFETEVNGTDLIQKYQWDFEGDGIFDYTSLAHEKIKHTYCEPGVYSPTVRVTDINNLSSQYKKEVKFGVFDPEDINKGKIIASPKKGRAPLTIKFSFETENVINDAEYLWDFENDGVADLITSMPEAEYTYNEAGVYTAKLTVRTVNNIIMSCYEAVYITRGNSGNEKRIIPSNKVYRDKIGRVELSDKTSLILPADILEKEDIVDIKKLESSLIRKEIDIENNKSAGEYREYSFANHKDPFNKEMIISIPYIDADEDGIVDDEDIDELTLDAYWYDENKEEWMILSDALVFPRENIVTVKTNHFTVFGIAGSEKKESDFQSEGNSGDINNCFIATAAFDSPMAKEVVALREFRDKYLLTSNLGKSFVNFYYHFSPPIAEFIKHKPLLKFFIRCHLKLLVSLAQSIL